MRNDITDEFVFPNLSGEGPKLGSILEKKLSKNDLERFTLSDHLWNYLQDYKKKHNKVAMDSVSDLLVKMMSQELSLLGITKMVQKF